MASSIKCPYCDGEGKKRVECNVCHGSGTQECVYDDVTGTCTCCGGRGGWSGNTDCTHCRGRGTIPVAVVDEFIEQEGDPMRKAFLQMLKEEAEK